jgi:hypothetical protein
MTRTIRRLVATLFVAAGLSVGTLVLVGGTGHSSVPSPHRTASAAVSGCAPAPAPCGTNSLDELAIHAANEAAQRANSQTSGATGTPNTTR